MAITIPEAHRELIDSAFERLIRLTSGIPGELGWSFFDQIQQGGSQDVTFDDLTAATLTLSGAVSGVTTLALSGKLLIPTAGAAATVGTATLSGGTVTVATTAIGATSKVFYCRKTTGGTVGHLSIGAVVAGTSFVLQSDSATETSTLNWWIINN